MRRRGITKQWNLLLSRGTYPNHTLIHSIMATTIYHRIKRCPGSSAMGGVCLAIGAYAAYSCFEAYSNYRNNKLILRSTLDVESEEMASLLVDDGTDYGRTENSEELDSDVVQKLQTNKVTYGCAEYDLDPFKVKLHRVVNKRNRNKYTNLVVAEAKLVFGVPKRTEANYKSVRRVVVKLMQNHGVRPSHISTMLPGVVEMVFLPSKFELEAKRLASSAPAWARVVEYMRLSAMTPSAWLSGTG